MQAPASRMVGPTLKGRQGRPLDHLFEQQPLWATATDDPEVQHVTSYFAQHDH